MKHKIIFSLLVIMLIVTVPYSFARQWTEYYATLPEEGQNIVNPNGNHDTRQNCIDDYKNQEMEWAREHGGTSSDQCTNHYMNVKPREEECGFSELACVGCMYWIDGDSDGEMTMEGIKSGSDYLTSESEYKVNAQPYPINDVEGLYECCTDYNRWKLAVYNKLEGDDHEKWLKHVKILQRNADAISNHRYWDNTARYKSLGGRPYDNGICFACKTEMTYSETPDGGIKGDRRYTGYIYVNNNCDAFREEGIHFSESEFLDLFVDKRKSRWEFNIGPEDYVDPDTSLADAFNQELDVPRWWLAGFSSQTAIISLSFLAMLPYSIGGGILGAMYGIARGVGMAGGAMLSVSGMLDQSRGGFGRGLDAASLALDFFGAGRVLRAMGDEGLSAISRFLRGACFLPGTKVMTADGEKNIEDVKVGEAIYSYNHLTNKIELKKVLKTKVRTAPSYLIVTYGDKEVKVTPEHRFFDGREYKAISEFKVGDKIILNDYNRLKKVTIQDIENVEQEVTVYNFEVEDNHNYFAEGALVHNSYAKEARFSDLMSLARKKNGRISDAASREIAEEYAKILELEGITVVRDEASASAMAAINKVEEGVPKIAGQGAKTIDRASYLRNNYQTMSRAERKAELAAQRERSLASQEAKNLANKAKQEKNRLVIKEATTDSFGQPKNWKNQFEEIKTAKRTDSPFVPASDIPLHYRVQRWTKGLKPQVEAPPPPRRPVRMSLWQYDS